IFFTAQLRHPSCVYGLDMAADLGEQSRLALLRRQRQAKHRNLPLPSYIHHRFPGVRQVQSLAMLAAVDLSIQSPGLFHIPAILLDQIHAIKPALQMAAAKLAFLVFLVAGALPRLLDLDLVTGKLRSSLHTRSGDFARHRGTGCGRCPCFQAPPKIQKCIQEQNSGKRQENQAHEEAVDRADISPQNDPCDSQQRNDPQYDGKHQHHRLARSLCGAGIFPAVPRLPSDYVSFNSILELKHAPALLPPRAPARCGGWSHAANLIRLPPTSVDGPSACPRSPPPDSGEYDDTARLHFGRPWERSR